MSCFLEQETFTPQKVLVIPRNRWLRLNITEKLFTGTLNHNQNKNKHCILLFQFLANNSDKFLFDPSQNFVALKDMTQNQNDNHNLEIDIGNVEDYFTPVGGANIEEFGAEDQCSTGIKKALSVEEKYGPSRTKTQLSVEEKYGSGKNSAKLNVDEKHGSGRSKNNVVKGSGDTRSSGKSK